MKITRKIIMENYIQGFVILLSCISAVLSCQGATLLNTGITEQEKSIILQEHNKLRATVAMGRVPNQPGAENMREMQWDEELATRAQQWANNCQFKHDPHRTIDRFTMGQNMAIIWSTADIADDDGDFPSRIQSWFNEVQKYAFGSAWSPKTGHYSQLVWGETNLVGCGFSYYKDTKKFNKLYVCNYGPGGNVVGDNPYEVGRPACKNYGMKPSHQYQGLCSSPSTGSQQNSIDTTFTFKSTSYTNSKSSYNSQYQQQQQQQQQQQPQQQQSYYHNHHQQQQQQTQPQRPSPFSFHSSYHTQQQQTKPVNPNYDYSFKSFFKQTKKPSFDW